MKLVSKYFFVSVINVICFILISCTPEEPKPPLVMTMSVYMITGNSALCSGEVIDEGTYPVTSRGICWSKNSQPTLADNHTIEGVGLGSFSSLIEGLNPATTYTFRAYATNLKGTSYGSPTSFSTLGGFPTAVTTEVIVITGSSAILEGVAVAHDLETTVVFEYGLSTAYGNYTIANESPINGNSMVYIQKNITGLQMATTYHYRITAENAVGKTYGEDMIFTTRLEDVDGNLYNTVKIGSQLWMKENLKTKRFNDGISIPLIIENDVWTILTTSAFCWLWNNDGFKDVYGALYNWYAVETGKLCPSGWHTPTDAEWTILSDYLGGSDIAGRKLKSNESWLYPNDATNESGFTALAGGLRNYYNGYFGTPRGDGTWFIEDGNWWSSSIVDENLAWNRVLKPSSPSIERVSYNKKGGLSVRCLKN